MIYRKQEHTRGCGLACVAMVLGIPYNWVREDYDELFGAPAMVKGAPRGKSSLEYGTDAQELHILLQLNRVDSHKKLVPFNSWGSLPDVAILAVNYRQRPPDIAAWHWVVFDRKSNAVYDPWLRKQDINTNIRKDYKRMRPKYYMGVHVER